MSSLSCSVIANPTVNARDLAYKRRVKRRKERITEVLLNHVVKKKREKRKRLALRVFDWTHIVASSHMT